MRRCAPNCQHGENSGTTALSLLILPQVASIHALACKNAIYGRSSRFKRGLSVPGLYQTCLKTLCTMGIVICYACYGRSSTLWLEYIFWMTGLLTPKRRNSILVFRNYIVLYLRCHGVIHPVVRCFFFKSGFRVITTSTRASQVGSL